MKRGFTLIELVMVIVILGILAATALPRFINLTAQATDNAALATLGNFRAAVAVRYAENAAGGDTTPIPAIGEITGAIFQDGTIPNAPVGSTPPSNAVVAGTGAAIVDPDGAGPLLEGGWQYDASTGRVYINSDNPDRTGALYLTY